LALSTMPGCSMIDDATEMGGGRYGDLRVRHVVRAAALAATQRPKKAPLDKEWSGRAGSQARSASTWDIPVRCKP
jgi:hypothetical protein